MKIKLGDQVKIISGKDRGKDGKVLQSFPKLNQVVVEKVNKLVKHLRPQKKSEKGQKIEFFAPLAVSKVMLICPSCQKPTRVKYKLSGSVKQRLCKRCQAVVDKLADK